MSRKPKPWFRCSSLPRVLRCYGSQTLCDIVAPRQGDDGFDGSLLHWDIAWAAVKQLGAEQPEGGIPMPDVPAGWKRSSFLKWIPPWALHHLKSTIPEDWALDVETELKWEFERWGLIGHLDYAGTSPDQAESDDGDWKTGIRPVDPAPENDQGLGYIVLRKKHWPALQKMRFSFAQPRLDGDLFDSISTVEIAGETIDRCVQSLDDRMCYALDHGLELETGMKQCAWCDAATQCPALIKLRDDMRMTLTPEMLHNIRKTPDDAKLAEFVMLGRTLNRPLKDAEEMLKERIALVGSIVAADGTTVSVKESGGNYECTDRKAAYEAITRILPAERVAECMSVTTSDAKDQIAQHYDVPVGGNGANTGKTIFDAKLGPFFTQKTKKMFIFQ